MIHSVFRLLFWILITTNNLWPLEELAKYDFFYSLFLKEARDLEYFSYTENVSKNEIVRYCRYAFSGIKDKSIEEAIYVYIYTENFYPNTYPYFECMKINRNHYEIMSKKNPLGLSEIDYSLILEELDYLWKVYDLIDDINRPNFYLYQKRIKAYELRILLGDEAFENKIIPNYLPLHLYRVID